MGLHVMMYHMESFDYKKPPHFRSTNHSLVMTSVSIALQNVGPMAQCP